MRLELVQAPTEMPVTVDELRVHVWTDYNEPGDGLKESLIAAATGHFESITGRKLIKQTWRAYLDDFPFRQPVELPFGRVLNVTRVNWLDASGVDHVVTPFTGYIPAIIGENPQLHAVGGTWPSGSFFQIDPVRIEFEAGFGAAADVPREIRQAILLLAAHWYENREAVLVGTTVREVPLAFKALSDPWRLLHVC